MVMKLIAQSENIEKFSENNYIYIDKTEYIYNLTKTMSEFSFPVLAVLANL